MNLLTAIKVAQLLRALAPLIPTLYAGVKEAFPAATGLQKFDAFVNQVRSYVPVVEELKPFGEVLETAIPNLKRLVTDFHEVQKQSAPAASPAATTTS